MNQQDPKENLPWYVNKSLPDDELEDIERQLENDESLKQDVEFMNKLRAHLKNSTQSSPGEFGLQRLKQQIKKEASSGTTKRWRNFAVAASLLMVIQAGIMLSLIQQQDVGIVPLSGDTYSGPVLQIQFKDYAKESEIRAIILSINGSIIEGPSTLGIYRVQLADDDIDIIDQRISQLHNKLDLIDFVSAE